MADLTTPAGIEAELVATARYDVDDDLSLAKRRVAALRRKLDLSSQATRESDSYTLPVAQIKSELDSALAFVASKASQSEAARLANPSVVHADFSQTGKYYGGTFT